MNGGSVDPWTPQHQLIASNNVSLCMNHNFKVKVMNEKKIIIRELGQTLCFTCPAQFVGFSSINNCEDDNDDEEDGADDSRGDDVASDADAVITAKRITNRDVCFFHTEKS